ncbi:rRNA maturation RNase YbeY [Kocuria sp. CCUG 69068]|uniref:rRNA maturation RNase YbeY n=1 Tax=Kocuria TaxID=57493 RepID=UPI001E34D4E3|nr:rRNA maturation RNase YbeY [Kocuria rosea]MCC5783206.1 rRNA maturation RNase YbeY [Kocuria sp. CCUG 69068]WJZ64975.1 rRNA maturation RNase YbeY [Kocuria rosea]
MAVEFDLQVDPQDVPAGDRAAWEAVDVELLGRLADHVLERLHVHPDAELSIAVVDEDEMARLHVEWMDLPGPTDVLSFPMDEMRPGTPEEPAEGTLGDIVLCPPVARRQAEAGGHSVADELCLLTTHGILHLLGHDHAEPEERQVMFALQRDLLTDFLGRPAPVETME